MPRLIVTEDGGSGLDRCLSFLVDRDENAAKRVVRLIEEKFQLLTRTPQAGRPVRNSANLRELVIPFGASGNVALYRHVPKDDAVYILAFRHQREKDY